MASGREDGVEHLPEHIGRYQILGLLGTGGMAEILLARINGPSGFERPVVIKRILPHLAREQRFRDMFLDEARIVAGIRHPNVVQVHELGQEGDELYLVMEYLEGESAAGVARRLAAHGKLLNFGLCAHLMSEVAAGLHAAHELTDPDGKAQELVHRDVSPANVFLGYGGDVKMIDFGIAVAADRVSKTEAGQVKGKYAYMSPEQCMGVPLDRRSDVFSMGTVLYELSTCRRLFKRQSDMLTLQAICHEAVPPPTSVVPEYPPDLERICLRALEKRPERRYASAYEMRRDLIEVARRLNGPKIPEESLAKVMRRLFSDRIEEKRAMLTRLRAGERVAEVPAAEIEDGIEPQDVEVGVLQHVSMMHSMTLAAQSPLRFGHDTSTHSATGAESSEPSMRPRRWPAIVGALGLAGGIGVAMSLPLGDPPPAPSRAELAAVPASVRIEVESEPPGAKVVFAGVEKGVTPVAFETARAEAELPLAVSLADHQNVSSAVVPDRDRHVKLVLVEVPSAPKRLAQQVDGEKPSLADKPAPDDKPARRTARPAARAPQPPPSSAPLPSPLPADRSSKLPADRSSPPEPPKPKPASPYSRFN